MPEIQEDRTRLIVSALAVVHVFLLVNSTLLHSPAYDETGHLAAGVLTWKTGGFQRYRVNPPLVRLVASLPALVMGLTVTADDASILPRDEFLLGARMVTQYGSRFQQALVWGRICCIGFSVLGLWACSAWANELFGRSASVVAAGLWTFNPSLLGHGALITPDVPAAALAVTACYYFWRWCVSPTFSSAVLAGLLLGAGICAKFTLLIFFAIWPCQWLILSFTVTTGSRLRGREFGQAMIIVLMAISILNSTYLFDGTFTRLGDFAFTSDALAGYRHPYDLTAEGNRFSSTLLTRLPVPIPAQAILGIDEQCREFEKGAPCFVGGHWASSGSWRYYFYAILVKEPVANLLAIAGALITLGLTFRRRNWGKDICLCVPGVAFFLIPSIIHGVCTYRYAFPILPFLFVWLSGFVPLFISLRFARCALVAIVGLSAIETIACYPHTFSFFNALAGGPRAGHRHLLFDALDWGQDLLLLKDWADSHPQMRPLFVHFSGSYDPRDLYTWDDQTFFIADHSTPLVDGAWYAMFATVLYSNKQERTPVAALRVRHPIAHIGYSVKVFSCCDSTELEERP